MSPFTCAHNNWAVTRPCVLDRSDFILGTMMQLDSEYGPPPPLRAVTFLLNALLLAAES